MEHVNFLCILMLETLMVVCLGLAISSAAPNVEAASAMGIPIIILSLIFGGYYINIDSLPPVADLFPYISIIYYTFSAFCINEFKDETFSCGSTGACFKTGEEVLDSLSIGTSIWTSLTGMFCLTAAFFILALILLEFSLPKFVSLGHIGTSYKKFETVEKG